MRLGDIFNPWPALANARALAQLWEGRAKAYAAEIGQLNASNAAFDRACFNYSGTVTELQRACNELRIERDDARALCLEAAPLLEELDAIKRKRSEATSRGNRTRSRRRRGALLPAPINDFSGAPAPHLRTELTG